MGLTYRTVIYHNVYKTNLDKNPRFLCLHDKKKTTSLTLALFGTRSSIIICIFRLLRSIVNRL